MNGWRRGGGGPRREAAAAAARHCAACGEARPAAHAYCFADGVRLPEPVVRANTAGYRPPRVPLSHARLVAAGARPGSWGRRLGRAAVEVPLLVLALVGALTLVRSYQATGTVLPALGGPAAEAVVDGLRGALLPAGAGPGGPAAPGPGEPE